MSERQDTRDPAMSGARYRSRRLWVGMAAGTAIVIALAAFLLLRDTGSTLTTLEGNLTGDGAALDGAAFAGGLTWRVDGGTFVRGKAFLSGTASGPGPAFATLRPAGRPWTMNARFAHVASESGLVFNFVNPQNYWSVVAVYEYGTWNINRTVNGQTSFVANTGRNLSQTNTSVQLHEANGDVTVSIEGRPSMRVKAPSGSRARVGLLVSANEKGQTRWTGLSITS